MILCIKSNLGQIVLEKCNQNFSIIKGLNMFNWTCTGCAAPCVCDRSLQPVVLRVRQTGRRRVRYAWVCSLGSGPRCCAGGRCGRRSPPWTGWFVGWGSRSGCWAAAGWAPLSGYPRSRRSPTWLDVRFRPRPDECCSTGCCSWRSGPLRTGWIGADGTVRRLRRTLRRSSDGTPVDKIKVTVSGVCSNTF